jgi:tetratricopeptide (TPR) repeat protein
MTASGTTPARDSGWLYGPAIDLSLGAGGAYLVSIPVLLGLAVWLDAPYWSGTLASLLALTLNIPHYGATLLRVYEHPEDRRRYALFSLWATLGLLGAFVASLHLTTLGSWLITLYFTWSPWHFAGQNYGLGLMFMRRRGLTILPLAKRLFYASFLLSFALSFLAIHQQGSTAIYAPGPSPETEVFSLIRVGIPPGVIALLLPVLAGLYLAALAGAAFLLVRAGAGLRDLIPPALLVAMQALWFAVPGVGAASGLFALEGLPFVAVWISAAHSVQYLWVTSYYERRADPAIRLLPYLTRTLLVGAALITVPALLFAPRLLGAVEYYAGLAVLIFAVVNLHHFVLDGAVWKLRDGRVARALLRTEPGTVQAGEPQPRTRSWLGPVVAALGVASIALTLVHLREHSVGIAGEDAERVAAAARRLSWMQRDNPAAWGHAAALYAREGRVVPAIAAYREAIALHPHWHYQTNLAWLIVLRGSADPGEIEEARQLAESAAEAVAWSEPEVLDTLAAAYAAEGRFELAERTAGRAEALARAGGNPALTEQVRERRDLYQRGHPYPPR